jgi:transcriptional regulator with XRE-family HTH domain
MTADGGRRRSSAWNLPCNDVRQARLDRGWSQEDLSGKTGLATVRVSRIERGVREIRLTTLVRLLDGPDVPPETLLDGLLGQS